MAQSEFPIDLSPPAADTLPRPLDVPPIQKSDFSTKYVNLNPILSETGLTSKVMRNN